MRSDWEEVSLGDVVTLRNGAGVKQIYFTEYSNGVPLVKISNFSNGSIFFENPTLVDVKHAKEWNNHILYKNDILIATVGSWPPNWSSVVGQVVKVPTLAEGAIQNQNTCCVIPGKLISQNFLYYRLKSKEFLIWVSNMAQGSANQARIPIKKLARYKFKMPVLIKQKKIAHILSTLDDKIELNQKMNETLEAMAQALFKSWFVDFDPVHARAKATSDAELEVAAKELGISREVLELFSSTFVESEMGMVPEGWEVKSIYDIANVIYGAPFSSKNFNDTQVGKPLIRIRDLKTFSSQHWTEEVHSKGTLVKAGDLLIGMDAEFTPTIWQGIDGWLNQRVCKIESLNDTFTAFHYFSLKPKMKFFERANVGTTVIHLGKKDIDTISILVPDKHILEQAKKIIEPAFNKLVQNSIENRSLQKTRDTLLPKLLSGELDVSEIEIKE